MLCRKLPARDRSSENYEANVSLRATTTVKPMIVGPVQNLVSPTGAIWNPEHDWRKKLVTLEESLVGHFLTIERLLDP